MTDGRTSGTPGRLGLGCNNFGTRIDAATTAQIVGAALDLGVTHLDTAERYGDGASEELLGQALRGRRSEALVATKFGRRPGAEHPDGPPGTPANVRRSCEGSLRRLGVDHLDLYYLHYPDPLTPVAETMGALAELQDAGLIRAVGVSNHSPAQLVEAAGAAAGAGIGRLHAAQLEWSLLRREAEADLVPTCRQLGVGVVPYFPLASGLLTGKYRRGEAFPEGTRLAAWPHVAERVDAAAFDLVERATALADELERSLLEVSLGWLGAQDGVATVLAGATSVAQLRANADAMARPLTAHEVARVTEGLDRG